MGATEEKVARFIVETEDDEIPAEAIKWAKVGSFDCMGVMLAGAASAPGKILAKFVKERGGALETTVVGAGLRTSCTLGALANGAFAHALDYDDMEGWAHPSCVLFPPLISLGEHLGVSGREILNAYVIGFKVGQAIRSSCPSYNEEERGFHTTSIFGVLGATAACARLLKLNVEQTMMALGNAGSMGGGLDQNIGSYAKCMHAGMAGQNGVMACLLARDGWTGTDKLLESRLGFLSSYAGKDCYNLEAIGNTLAKRPLSIELKIKKYPCCGCNHGVIESLVPLLSENNIGFDDIERVVIDNVPSTSPVMLYSVPSSGFQGKFSLRYNAAMAILDKRVDIDSFSEEQLKRPQVHEAMRKVEIHLTLPWDSDYDPATGEYPVTVMLRNGRSLSRTVNRRTMRGTPADPMTDGELKAKFKANAALSLPRSAVDRACDLWWSMEKMDNISQGLEAVSGTAVARI